MVKEQVIFEMPRKEEEEEEEKNSLELTETFRVDMIHLWAAIWPWLLLIEGFALS